MTTTDQITGQTENSPAIFPGSILSQPQLTVFWSTNNLTNGLNRMGGRVFVGAAGTNSGDFSYTTGSTVKDWLDTFEGQRTAVPGYRTSFSQFASLSSNGGVAILGGTRTSDVTDPLLTQGQFSNAITAEAINDNTTYPQHAAAFYGVGFQIGTAGHFTGGGTVGAEFDVVNENGATHQSLPSNLWPAGFTTALQLNSGAAAKNVDPTRVLNSASAALTIGNNQSDFLAGIVIAENAIAGVTIGGGGAVTGAGSAIRMGTRQQIEWWLAAGGAPVLNIVSQVATPANGMAWINDDLGTKFTNVAQTGNYFQILFPSASPRDYIQVSPSIVGTDAKINLGGGNNDKLGIGTSGTGYTYIYVNSTEKARFDATLATLATALTINGDFYGPAGATNMTSGFVYVPSGAGAPTGVPTARTGRVPMYYDATNNKIYVYNGAWKATAALT